MAARESYFFGKKSSSQEVGDDLLIAAKEDIDSGGAKTTAPGGAPHSDLAGPERKGGLLNGNPIRRFSVEEALKHPWLLKHARTLRCDDSLGAVDFDTAAADSLLGTSNSLASPSITRTSKSWAEDGEELRAPGFTEEVEFVDGGDEVVVSSAMDGVHNGSESQI